MNRLRYVVTIICADQNVGAEAASELIETCVNIGNSYDVTVEAVYEGTLEIEAEATP